MKKILLIICTMMMLTGCSDKSPVPFGPREAEVESTYDDTEMQTDEDDSWKYAVAERLFDEFCYFYDNMEEKTLLEEQYEEMQLNKKPLGYNFIMAMDRLVGISMVYHKYLPEEKLEIFRQKYGILEYARHYTNIRFSYTPNGLHFMAVYYEDYDNYTAPVKHEAINRIRGLDEYSFLTDFAESSQYDAVDLFAEDLSGNKQSIPVRFVLIYDSLQGAVPEIVDPNNLDNKSKEILQNYGRNATDGNATNNAWGLYVLKNGKGFEGISSGSELAQITSLWRIP